jgi:hypothetical protein
MIKKRIGACTVVLGCSLLFGTAHAQQQDAPQPTAGQPVKGTSNPLAYLVPADISFAHIAVGDVWRTSFFICNMSNHAIPYTISYYDDNGYPMSVPVYIGDGIYESMSSASYTIAPYGEQNFDLWNSNPTLQTGQAILSYDSNLGQLGGFSVFQEVVPGRPVYEATVALSGSDFRLYLPYYHFKGYTSGVAISNPSLTRSTTVTLTALDNSGNSLFTDYISLPAGGHFAFSVTDRYPQLNNLRGNLYMESSNGHLSAVGLRFSATGSYTTIPIMNWTGMF